jgi:hypothetical protein
MSIPVSQVAKEIPRKRTSLTVAFLIRGVGCIAGVVRWLLFVLGSSDKGVDAAMSFDEWEALDSTTTVLDLFSNRCGNQLFIESDPASL